MTGPRPVVLSKNLSGLVIRPNAENILGWKRVVRVSDKANQSYVDVEFTEILPLVHMLLETLQVAIMKGDI